MIRQAVTRADLTNFGESELYHEVPRGYLIARTSDSFWTGKVAIESIGNGKFRIPATWVNQQVREERGYEDPVSRSENWVLEGVLYVKDKKILTPIGLPYLHPEEATLAHLTNREFTLKQCKKVEVEKAIADGLEIKAGDFAKGELVIPCRDFGSNVYSLFFFGGTGTDKEKSERASNSGEWLIDSPEKIEEITVSLDEKDYSTKVGTDYARQMFFSSLYWSSGLSDWDEDRGWRCGEPGVLGVYETAEGT